MSGYRKLKDGTAEKVGDYKCNMNCRFEVAEKSGDTITLKALQYNFVKAGSLDGNHDVKIIKTKGDYVMISYEIFLPVKKDMIQKHFIYGCCRTGHSLQGRHCSR